MKICGDMIMDSKNEDGSKRNRNLIILLLLLIVVCIFAYRISVQDDKDTVNNFASAFGVEKVIPWEERAVTATKRTIEGSEMALAGSVIGITHPSAKNPLLKHWSVSNHGGIICVEMAVEFTGGFSGNKYEQLGEWKFSKAQNFGYLILSDNAPFVVEEKNKKELEEYFQKEIYPVTLGNIN